MSDEPKHTPAKQLLEEFFVAIDESFRFLLDRGFSSKRRVEVVTSTGTKKVDLTKLPDNSFFWAEVRFAGQRCGVQITFGDREFTINTIIKSPAGPSEYALWEWLEALNATESVMNSDFATRPDRVREVVSGMGKALEAHLHEILNPDSALQARLLSQRVKRMNADKEYWASRDHQHAAARAAEAFRNKDYRRVLELLEPMEARLTPAEKKKLEYARGHAKGS